MVGLGHSFSSPEKQKEDISLSASLFNLTSYRRKGSMSWLMEVYGKSTITFPKWRGHFCASARHYENSVFFSFSEWHGDTLTSLVSDTETAQKPVGPVFLGVVRKL